MKSNLCAWYWQ